MIDALSTPQIEETPEYLAWVERVGSQEILESLGIDLDTINALFAEAAEEHTEE